MYTWLKFIHVASIAIWLGGLVTMLAINRALVKAGEQDAVRAIGKQGASLSMGLFMPASLLTLITGIGMVQVGHLSFRSTWIMWGIIGAIASFIIGAVLTGGAARKLGQQMAKGEVTPEVVKAAQRRIMMFAAINMLLLLSIVWAMVFKPA